MSFSKLLSLSFGHSVGWSCPSIQLSLRYLEVQVCALFVVVTYKTFVCVRVLRIRVATNQKVLLQESNKFCSKTILKVDFFSFIL